MEVFYILINIMHKLLVVISLLFVGLIACKPQQQITQSTPAQPPANIVLNAQITDSPLIGTWLMDSIIMGTQVLTAQQMRGPMSFQFTGTGLMITQSPTNGTEFYTYNYIDGKIKVLEKPNEAMTVSSLTSNRAVMEMKMEGNAVKMICKKKILK